jgi:succinoglycan biosynthesis transport protein ExoP
LVLGIAGLGGSTLGLGLILVGSLVRRRFESVAEVERLLDLPALAAVPAAKIRARGLALLDNPQVERVCAESFRTLRTALSVMGKGPAARSVLFVSACSGEGTSFVATNHAISLARQGYRTLLIDGNLHRPSLDDIFFAERNENGLANYLEGRPAAEKACRPTHVPDLFLLSAGRAAANPSELISGKKFQLLLADAQRWFHRIVIDAPALTRSNDALLMARQADHTVLVVNARSGSRTATGGVARRLALAGVQPVGFVFNQAQPGAAVWQPEGPSAAMRVPAGLRLGA